MTDRVLITGAGGFIGSHVVEAFLAEGRRVRALVHYNSLGLIGHLGSSPAALKAESDGRLEIVAGDVTDPYQMIQIANGCDVIIHMAALIGIPYSYIAPASYQNVNTLGTLHMLEAARACKARRIIVTSTSEVYGTAQYSPIDEKHPLQAQSPYSASKIAADKLAESYWRSFDVPVVTLRPFNTFGPRQSLRAVIPTVLAQALAGSNEIRIGSLDPKRDMTFVEDTARAFVLAASANGIDGETIHFGSGVSRSIGEIARQCLAAAGSKAKLVTDPERIRPAKSEVGLLLCNPEKARRLLNWQPTIPFEEAIARTAKYMKTLPPKRQPESYTL
ncbi:GDP-mannose 4,6-dehydratase [bacterium]|nr:GDP-mannose 4,6-dehydratase [bacterium]